MELESSVQSSSQNENIFNTSKKLIKTRYGTFPTLQEILSFSQIFCQWF